MRFGLVIFDCDGVLIDSELLSVQADVECLAEYGIDLSAEEVIERYTGTSSMVADLEARYGRALPGFDERQRQLAHPLFEAGLKTIPGGDNPDRFASLQGLRRVEQLARAVAAYIVARPPPRPFPSEHLQRDRGRAWQAGARFVPPCGRADGGRAAMLRRCRRQ